MARSPAAANHEATPALDAMSLPSVTGISNKTNPPLPHGVPVKHKANHSDTSIDDGMDHNINATSCEDANDVDAAQDTDVGVDTDTDMESDSDSNLHATSNDKNGATIDIPSDGERPGSWRMGLYSNLKQLVREAKGAASKPVVRFIRKYLRGTKLILVVGQTGTGKSTLLRELTGLDLAVGHTHNSGTKAYEVCPAVIDGEQYLFVDTAGFGAADLKDMDSFYDTMSCLDALGPFTTFAGILFVYGGTQPRMTGSDLTAIRWAKCFCGPEFYKHITIVSSRWDAFKPDEFNKRWNTFLGLINGDPNVVDMLNPAGHSAMKERYHGGAVYNHGLITGSSSTGVMSTECLTVDHHAAERASYARAMIKERYSTPPKVKPQVVRELEQGILWYNTEAAKVLKYAHRTLSFSIRNDFLTVTIVKDEERWRELGSRHESKGAREPLHTCYLPLFVR
ncbi:hypothetical protein NEMBOFW57_004533 [Staphylotrichum longicolle]|uniref:G domain-containing protein n=1 Tax=Staphylotrichum longicolle TaxID=669026 RepID=A0AAD4F7U2_9PEZI|nr:hypothetical protein NEMBOFW57_004533 [Staphylotrichum longicolle]